MILFGPPLDAAAHSNQTRHTNASTAVASGAPAANFGVLFSSNMLQMGNASGAIHLTGFTTYLCEGNSFLSFLLATYLSCLVA